MPMTVQCMYGNNAIIQIFFKSNLLRNDGMLELHFGLKSVAKPKQPITLNARIVVCHVCQFDSFLERSCYIAAK